MQTLLVVTIAGITIGAIYSLLGIGIVLAVRVTKVINLAQGEFYVIGAFIMTTLAALGVPLLVAVAAAILVGALVAGAEEVVLLRRMREASQPIRLLTTVGLSILLSGTVLLIWGRNPRTLPSFLDPAMVSIGPLQVTSQGILLVVTTLVAGYGLHLFLERTQMGRAMTATAEDPDGAQMTGLNVSALRLNGIMLAGALGGLAGAFALPLILIDFSMGLPLALRGFVAAVLGGMTVRGALIGGLVLGALESLVVRYASDLYRDVVVFGVLVAVLVVFSLRRTPLRRRATA